jgi:cell division protein FtsW (lipid II flippase)
MDRFFRYWFGYPDRLLNFVACLCGLTFVGGYFIALVWQPFPLLRMVVFASVIIFLLLVAFAVVAGIVDTARRWLRAR